MDYEIGSILRRRLDGISGLFGWHWGVCVGDGFVIHFNGERAKQRSAVIRRDTTGEFSSRRTVCVHARPKNLAHGRAIRGEACRLHDLVHGNGFNGSYDLVFRNCQDFCMQCYEVDYDVVDVVRS
jgi:hypothetical protein